MNNIRPATQKKVHNAENPNVEYEIMQSVCQHRLTMMPTDGQMITQKASHFTAHSRQKKHSVF
jgi:hypothetical protein